MNQSAGLNNKLFYLHYKDNILIEARAEDIFKYIDNHHRFSSHMSQSSWMMGGGQMKIFVDKEQGQKVGSHIQLSGKVFGIPLFVDEVITHRNPPYLKVWETVGNLKLLVIGHYQISIEIQPKNNQSSNLGISIDYNLPAKNVWLGKLFGGIYAKWCVSQMIKGVQSNFVK